MATQKLRILERRRPTSAVRYNVIGIVLDPWNDTLFIWFLLIYASLTTAISPTIY
jgi:hypothetical protein